MAGSLVSLALVSKLTALFSTGIVSAVPTPAFALAVLSGAAAWVLFATITRLPVSTTHSIVGALIGPGMLFAASSVQFAALGTRVVLPLLASIAVAYALSWLLALIPTRMTRRHLRGRAAPRPRSGHGDGHHGPDHHRVSHTEGVGERWRRRGVRRARPG